MEFQIGDKVQAANQNLSGIVMKITQSGTPVVLWSNGIQARVSIGRLKEIRKVENVEEKNLDGMTVKYTKKPVNGRVTVQDMRDFLSSLPFDIPNNAVVIGARTAGDGGGLLCGLSVEVDFEPKHNPF